MQSGAQSPKPVEAAQLLIQVLKEFVASTFGAEPQYDTPEELEQAVVLAYFHTTAALHVPDICWQPDREITTQPDYSLGPQAEAPFMSYADSLTSDETLAQHDAAQGQHDRHQIKVSEWLNSPKAAEA